MTNAIRTIASRYATIATPYRDHWAPVLAELARPALDRILERHPGHVVDLGCGAGKIASLLMEDGARVTGIDATLEMLLASQRAFARANGDATRLPLAGGCADAAISTFMLQHLPRPGRAYAEAARILRPGGVFASVTWGVDHDERGVRYEILDDAVERAGVQAAPPAKTWHHLVDSPAKVRRYARTAGFERIDARSELREFRWTAETFFGWSTSSGAHARMLTTLEEPVRARVVGEIRAALFALPPDAFVWRPEIVYLSASR